MKKLKCRCGAEAFSIKYDPSEDGLIFEIIIKCEACGTKKRILSTWSEDYATIDVYGEDIDVYE